MILVILLSAILENNPANNGLNILKHLKNFASSEKFVGGFRFR